MAAKTLKKDEIFSALKRLDELLTHEVRFVVGGGGALVAVYKFPLATEDVDAFALGTAPGDLQPLVEQVGAELKIPHDWLNPYFSTFAHVLPKDYGARLRSFFKGRHVEALALGPEDLLLMKCFAGRDKDIPHARALLKVPDVDIGIVEDRINELKENRVPGAEKALRFFDEITEDL